MVHGPELAAELRAAGWHLLEPIGHSPRSVVYRAARDGGEYALKVLRETSTAAGPPLVALRREAAVVTSVGHPGLPEVYEVGLAGPWPYLAMELLSGRGLGAVLAGGPMEVAEAVRLAGQVARALGAAHRAGMVHRDVKPDNIVFDRAGRPRLIDFGLVDFGAGALAEPAPGHGAAVGTLRYSPPEQSGMLKRPVDHRSDLYSLGVVLFECLAGRPPFTATEAGELLRAHAASAPPDLAALRPQVPPALAAVVATLLAKDPDDRYRGADGLVADLERVLAGETDFTPGTADEPLPARGDRALAGVGTEVALLDSCWRRTTDSGGRVVLVHGGIGTGKSRLLRELARAAYRDGRQVLSGRCLPDSPVPFGPLREAVDRLLATDPALVRQAAGGSAALLAPLSPALAATLGLSGADTGSTASTAFAAALAGFVAELARLAGGLLLSLDDVQWLDEASARVLREIAAEAPAVPLLVACAGRTDLPLDRFRAAAGDLAADLALPALSDEAAAQLLATEFGAPAEPAFVTRLAAFTRNNPYGLVMTARTLISAGLVRPHWGRAVVAEEAMDRVDLPPDVRTMIDSQLDLLGRGLPVLALAATIGDRFPLEVLLRLVPSERAGDVMDLLTLAVEWRLVEQAGPDSYRFVHSWVRQLVLDRVPAGDRADLHQRIAAALDPGELAAADPALVYQLAGHYTQGELDATPARAFEVCWAAARAALADHAPEAATGYLETAARAAGLAGIDPPPGFEATAGLARFAAGELDEAARRLELALAGESDRLRRAELLDQLARVEYARPSFAAMYERSSRALAELGWPVPATPPRAWLAAGWALLRAAACLCPGLYGTARGSTRQRYAAQLRMVETAGRAAYQMRPTRVQLALALRGLVAANRVGPSPEYVLGYVTMAMAGLTFGALRVSRWCVRRAERCARRLGDPRLAARVSVCRAYLRVTGGDEAGGTGQMRRTVVEQGRWLPTELYVEGAMAAASMLDLRGYAREAEQLRLLAVERGLPVPTFLSGSVVLGHPTEPDQQVAQAEHLLAAGNAPWQAVGPLVWSALMHCAAYVRYERGDLGPACDRLLAAMLRHGPRPPHVRPYFRRLWTTLAYIRLAQAAAAEPDRRAAAVELARGAVAVSGRLSRGIAPLRAHHLVALGALALLDGRPERALRRLAQADRLAERADAPAVRFESALVRARALRALGENPRVAVALAALLAEQHGWVHRAARVRSEYGDLLATPGPRPDPSAHDARSLRDGRYVDVLRQVSVAAASVLDPRELARVALDELLKVFGAERAYLFGCPVPDGPLERYAGRGAGGADLSDLAGYSTTLVERARAQRSSLVVTGTEQGAAVGSHSAVSYGLRSIMVAPLLFEGRLLGVVYLDSRVASGIFGADDQEILVAVASQLATALETARSARLEVQVEAERKQRELADRLREAAAELTSILDPDQVLARALGLAAAMVGADAGAVLLDEPDGTRVGAVHGRAAAAAQRAAGPELTLGSPVLLPPAMTDARTGPSGPAGPVEGITAEQLPGPLHVLLGRPRGWLAIPLTARGARFGLLLLASRSVGGGPEAHLGIAAAFAAQAATAYDNALLFRQVERLARTDGLTGLDNRRYFMEQATRELAGRHAAPVAALMVDIDHFKRVNDTLGHAAGDEVIRAVAHRIAVVLRAGDLLCRYGGEEFAILAHGGEAEIGELAQRLRAAVAAERVLTPAGAVRVTVSVGLALRQETDGTPEPVLARADAALYAAKQAGRDRVASARGGPPDLV